MQFTIVTHSRLIDRQYNEDESGSGDESEAVPAGHRSHHQHYVCCGGIPTETVPLVSLQPYEPDNSSH